MAGDAAGRAGRRRGVWGWVAISALLAVITLAVVGEVMMRRAAPILKGRVIETLSARFDGRVELDRMEVSVMHGLDVSGGGLRIYAPDDVVAAGATAPILAVRQFSFHAGLWGLFVKPTHVALVQVRGLTIRIPPREMRAAGGDVGRRRGKIKMRVDEIECDESEVVIETSKPGAAPKRFELQRIALRDVGAGAPWRYDATLVNAIPRGEIHAVGTFGPWNTESPGDSAVTGRYTFDHADLNTIKGIAGMLSSVGEFRGQLNRMEVEGTTETPDFSLDTANHAMPLRTKFSAIVDGTSGDTYLRRVDARLGETEFACSGAVTNQVGRGHTIDLDVDVPNGRLQDFLLLAVKTRPVVMTARIAMKTKMHLAPGKESVTRRLGLRSDFRLRRIHFTNQKLQDKVDMLSVRAQGHPEDAKPGAEDIASEMRGSFVMGAGRMRFSELNYSMPGATMRLAGVYSLDGEQFDFAGKVRTQATISEMVESRWKRWMLKMVDPFFRKNGAGAEIPVRVSGTKGEPKFGLDLFHKREKPRVGSGTRGR